MTDTLYKLAEDAVRTAVAACTGDEALQLYSLAARAAVDAIAGRVVPSGHVSIAHDDFSGDIIGHYVTREGKPGVVVQQDGTRVVHVYGEKWIAPAESEPAGATVIGQGQTLRLEEGRTYTWPELKEMAIEAAKGWLNVGTVSAADFGPTVVYSKSDRGSPSAVPPPTAPLETMASCTIPAGTSAADEPVKIRITMRVIRPGDREPATISDETIDGARRHGIYQATQAGASIEEAEEHFGGSAAPPPPAEADGLVARMRRSARYDTPVDPRKLLREGADHIETLTARIAADKADIERLRTEALANHNLAVANGLRAREEEQRAEAAEAHVRVLEEQISAATRLADHYLDNDDYAGQSVDPFKTIDGIRAALAAGGEAR